MALRPGRDGGTLPKSLRPRVFPHESLSSRVEADLSRMPGAPNSMYRYSSVHRLAQFVRHGVAMAVLMAGIIALPAGPAAARGPENIADVAEQVIDAVVNISTSQKVDPHVAGMPDPPPRAPVEEFFNQFFKNRRGQGDNSDQAPRRINSLGSGFIIDPSGLVVPNNPVR